MCAKIWDPMSFYFIWLMYQGGRAMAKPVTWVEHQNRSFQNSTIVDSGHFYRRNRILHRDPQIRYRPIAVQPTSKLHIVQFPTFLNRFFNITKRFSKKRSTHLENEYSVIPYHMEPFCQDYKTLFEEMFDSSRNCIQCISLPFWIVFFNVTKRFSKKYRNLMDV